MFWKNVDIYEIYSKQLQWPNTFYTSLYIYHGENKLHFDKMMMMSALYWTNTLMWMFIDLSQWNNSPRVDTSIHSDTLFWFRANQSLHVLLSAACLAEKQYVLGLTRSGSLPRFSTRGEHTSHLMRSMGHVRRDKILIVSMYMYICTTDVYQSRRRSTIFTCIGLVSKL